MKVLVLNCGSSSIKYKLYNMDDNSVLAAGGVERIGLDEAFIKVTMPNGEKKKIMHDMPDHKEGVNFVFQCLLNPEFGAIKSLDEIDAVGHRIVQGGDLFEKSVIVDKSVEDGIETTTDETTTTTTSGSVLPGTNVGDVNLDGKVDLLDAICLNKYLAQLITLTPIAIANANCDQKDGTETIDDKDTTVLMKFVLGNEDIKNLPYVG